MAGNPPASRRARNRRFIVACVASVAVNGVFWLFCGHLLRSLGIQPPPDPMERTAAHALQIGFYTPKPPAAPKPAAPKPDTMLANSDGDAPSHDEIGGASAGDAVAAAQADAAAGGGTGVSEALKQSGAGTAAGTRLDAATNADAASDPTMPSDLAPDQVHFAKKPGTAPRATPKLHHQTLGAMQAGQRAAALTQEKQAAQQTLTDSDADTGDDPNPSPGGPTEKKPPVKPNATIVLKLVKTWTPRPDQKFVLPPNLNIQLPDTIEIQPGPPLTPEQIDQIRKMLASQKMRHVGLDRKQLKKLLDAARRARDARKPDEKKDEKKKETQVAKKPAPHPPANHTPHLALVTPSKPRSPFTYRQWNPEMASEWTPDQDEPQAADAPSGAPASNAEGMPAAHHAVAHGVGNTNATVARGLNPVAAPGTGGLARPGQDGVSGGRQNAGIPGGQRQGSPGGGNRQGGATGSRQQSGGQPGGDQQNENPSSNQQGSGGTGSRQAAGVMGGAQGSGQQSNGGRGGSQNASVPGGTQGETSGEGRQNADRQNGGVPGGSRQHGASQAGAQQNTGVPGGSQQGAGGQDRQQGGASGSNQQNNGVPGNGKQGGVPGGRQGGSGQQSGVPGGSQQGGGGQQNNGVPGGQRGGQQNGVSGGGQQNNGVPGGGQHGGSQNNNNGGVPGGQQGSGGQQNGVPGGGQGAGQQGGQGNGGVPGGGQGQGTVPGGGHGQSQGNGQSAGDGGQGVLSGESGDGMQSDGDAGQVNGEETGYVAAVGGPPDPPEHDPNANKGIPGALVLPPAPPVGTDNGTLPDPRPVKKSHVQRPVGTPAVARRPDGKAAPAQRAAKTPIGMRNEKIAKPQPPVLTVGSTSTQGTYVLTVLNRPYLMPGTVSDLIDPPVPPSKGDRHSPLLKPKKTTSRGMSASHGVKPIPGNQQNAPLVQVARNSQGVKEGTETPLPATLLPSKDSEVGDGSGLKGQYYIGRNFDTYLKTQADANIEYDWHSDTTPDDRIPVGSDWSIRWTGKIAAPTTEKYTFYASADDGVRVWINHRIIIDDWTLHAAQEYSNTVTMIAGKQYDIKVEYFESGGPPAAVELYWESPTTPKQFIPESAYFYPLPTDEQDMEKDAAPAP